MIQSSKDYCLDTAFSLFIFWSMVKKNKKFAQEVAEGKKTRSLGSLTRMSVAGLAAIIALRYPDEFQVVCVVCGINDSLYCHYDRLFYAKHT